MRIAVIGSGNIGTTIGGAWERAGHEVSYARSSTSPDDLSAMLDAAEAVLVAIPGGAVGDWLAANGSALAGKLVFDATNNIGVATINNVAAFAEHAPDVRLVRAFSTLGWEVMAEPSDAALFWAGPEEAEPLVADVGLRPVRVGDIDAADVVDGAGRLWLTLVFRQGMPRTIALKLVGG